MKRGETQRLTTDICGTDPLNNKNGVASIFFNYL